MATSSQYLRKFSFITADAAGAGLELNQFRIRFTTRQFDLQSWNSMTARIYNLSKETAQRVETEFSQVQVQAGYENGAYATIFKGQVKIVKRGRESQTDTYLEVIANSGVEGMQFGVVNYSVAKNGSLQDVLKACQAALTPYGIGDGWSDKIDLSSITLPRAQTHYGKVIDVLREVCVPQGLSFSIHNDQLLISKYPLVDNRPTIPQPDDSETAVVLTRKTGLVGVPEQLQDGIHARCLLNPNLHAKGYVQIDSETINRTTVAKGIAGGFLPSPTGIGPFDYIPDLADTNGVYKIMVAEHHGDSRGQEWYTNLIGVKPGSYVPAMISRGLS